MKRTPISPILDLQRRLDELFEEVIFRRWPIPGGPVPAVREWIPDVDLHELADGFLIEVDLPGLSAEEVRDRAEPSGHHDQRAASRPAARGGHRQPSRAAAWVIPTTAGTSRAD